MRINQPVFGGAIFLLLAGMLPAGCDRNAVRVYQAPKEAASAAGDPNVGTPDASAGVDPSAKPSWVLPTGWKQAPTAPDKSFIVATFQIDPADPSLLVTISHVGGDLLFNVNRWEGQVGNPPIAEEDLPKVAKQSVVNSVPVDRIDLIGVANPDGEAKRILVARFPAGDESWFVKLMGPTSKVQTHQPDFNSFVNSIAFVGAPADAPASGDPHAGVNIPPGAVAVAPGDFRLKSWKTPDGWMLDQQPTQMRLMTFHIHAAGENADVIASVFGADEFTDPVRNLNMWRDAVGLEHLAAVPATPKVTIPAGDTQAELVDFTGPAGNAPAGRILVAIVNKGNQTFYFKLVGGEKAVTDQKPAFESFLKSLEFAHPE